MKSKIDTLNWGQITEDMHAKGYSVIRDFLPHNECENFKRNYSQSEPYRKTVVMERYRFGSGEYKYFDYPLPGAIQEIRVNLYPNLVPIANAWMKALKIPVVYPASLTGLHEQCRNHQQSKATVLVLKYGPGGYNTLHQDLYGEVYFPIQAVLFLDEPEVDFTGGEFVLTQQTPRAQSRAMVLKPGKGDLLLFATNFRPAKGKKGYYRMKMKHGVSEIHTGERHSMGIIFHDAET